MTAAAAAVLLSISAIAAPVASADVGLGSSFTYLSASAVSTCAGTASTVTATDTWQSSGAGAAPHSVDIDGTQVQTFDSAAGSGSDSVPFVSVSPGHHVVDFASEDGNARVLLDVCPSTIAATSATITSGAATPVTATLRDATTRAVIGSVRVTLLERIKGAWRGFAATTTDANGVARWTVSPRATAQFRWSFAGNSSVAGTTSAVQTVTVRQRVVARLRGNASRLEAWGLVAPVTHGAHVFVQTTAGRGWRNVAVATLMTQRLPDGTVRPGYAVWFTRHAGTYRVFSPATPIAASGASTSITVR